MKAFSRIVLSTFALFLLGWGLTARAEHKPKDEDCLACHSDSTLSTEANGKKISLYVDAAKLKHSVHGSMFACVDCHKDVKSLAHETPPKKITCAQCHADAQDAYAHSMHAKASKAGKTPLQTARTVTETHTRFSRPLMASRP